MGNRDKRGSRGGQEGMVVTGTWPGNRGKDQGQGTGVGNREQARKQG